MIPSLKSILNELLTEAKKKKKVWILPSFNPNYERGVLDKALKMKEEDNIPFSKLNKFINKLRKKAEGDKKLSPEESYLLKRAVMVRTLKRFKRQKRKKD
jgi:hypothetical protein